MTIAVSKRFDELNATGLMPSPTGVAMEILRLTQQESSTTEQIAQTIQTDPALTGRTLKFANSSHACARRPIASVSEAIVRLGMRTVGTLTLGFSVLSSSRKGSCKSFDYGQFWSKSLARGIATKVFCEPVRVAAAEEGFACGLLSEVGKLALASVYPEDYSELLSVWDQGSSEKLIELEREAFDTNHLELTAAMLQDWGLPETFQLAVLHQQDFASSDLDENSRERKMAVLLRTAEQIASLCIGDEDQQGKPVEDLLENFQQIGLEADALAGLYDEIAKEWHNWGEILNVSTCPVRTFAELVEQSNTSESSDISEQERSSSESGTGNTTLRILVAEDDPAQLSLVSKIITSAGHSVIGASNGREALQTALETNPDAVVTDWHMPEITGSELCSALRKTKFGRQLYLIIMTSDETEERLVEAFDAGADDYVVKPLRARSLQARLRAATRMIELQREVNQEREQIRKITREVAVANRKLEQAALTDALTGLPNRRYLIERLSQEWAKANRSGTPLSCILLDIDNFKSVNDSYGHDVGDLVLKKVASILDEVSRKNDIVCRQGGEEFIVICPDSNQQGVMHGAERIRRFVEEQTRGAFKEFDHPITISLGVATRTAETLDEDALIKAADEAMYAAKAGGRNKVCSAEDKPTAKESLIKGKLRTLFQ